MLYRRVTTARVRRSHRAALAEVLTHTAIRTRWVMDALCEGAFGLGYLGGGRARPVPANAVTLR